MGHVRAVNDGASRHHPSNGLPHDSVIEGTELRVDFID
jgi:hypothetical protein